VFWEQGEASVRLEWGEAGVRHLAPGVDAVVIVDVLSFSTCVDVAASRGAEVLAAVFAACLRNAAAVGARLSGRYERILVVPAGERWPDGTLRPTLEDLLGAGAAVGALGLETLGGSVSPEAQSARVVFRAMRDQVPEVLAACASGRELIERGFPQDVTLAADLDVSRCVPMLRGTAFVDAGG
jgi:2-phosphosulfolactate phosphatase